MKATNWTPSEEGLKAHADACTGYALGRVLLALNEAEELGGPEGHDYVWLMREIANEATKRAEAALATMRVEANEEDSVRHANEGG